MGFTSLIVSLLRSGNRYGVGGWSWRQGLTTWSWFGTEGVLDWPKSHHWSERHGIGPNGMALVRTARLSGPNGTAVLICSLVPIRLALRFEPAP